MNRQKQHRPDSLKSWLTCICASLYEVLNLGFVLSFGVLFPALMKEFEQGRQKTAWVGSLAIALTFFLCPLGSILCKNIGCRFTAIAGGLTCALSLLVSSYSCSLVLMFFTFSFMYGLGAALIFMASFLIAAKNFRKRQSLAVGVVSVGGSVGVLIFGPFLQLLIDMVGWRGTYRIMSALFSLACTLGVMFKDPLDGDHENEETTESRNFNGKECSNSDDDIGEENKNCDEHASDLPASNVEAIVKDMKKESKKTSKLLDFSVFKFPRFTVLVISLTFMYFGHYTPPLHLVKHCLELGISADSASRLFIFIGLASSLARVVTGRLCDTSRVNAIYVHQFGDLLVGIATIVLPLLKGYTGILLFAIVYGIGDGIFVTTMNSLLLFTVDEKRRAAAFGMGSNICSLGIAGGPPLAGFLADTFNGYKWSFTVAGILMLCAGVLPVVLVCFKKKENRRVELQCNPVNTDTNGTPTSVLSGCPYKRVSVKWSSTVQSFETKRV